MSLDDQAAASEATATQAAPETQSSATGATGEVQQAAETTGASADDVRATQIEALKAARARETGEEERPDKAKPTKDPATGKFVGKQQDKSATGATGEVSDEEKTATGEDKPKAEQQPSAPPPAHLAPDVKAVWDKIPEDARQIIAARSLEDRQRISRYGEAAKRFEPFGKVLQQHADYFATNDTPPDQVMANLLSWDRAVQHDPVNQFPALVKTYGLSKAEAQQMVSHIAQAYGFESPGLPSMDADALSLPPDPNTVALQAQYDAATRQNQNLQRQLAAMQQTLTAREQAELDARQSYAAEQESATLNQMVETFRLTVDTAQFDELRPLIAAEIQRLPDSVPWNDLVKVAYQNITQKIDARVNSALSTREKKRAEEAAKAAAAAKRAGSVNVEGAPQPAPATTSIRDEQRASLARFRAMNGAAA